MSEQSQPFTDMAEDIERNTNFGGAIVIVPPVDAGSVVRTLLLDPTPDPAQFWQMLLTKCQIQIAEIEVKQRTNQTFGRR